MRNAKLETPNRKQEVQPFGINYQWSGGDGIRCSSHTVALGRDRSDAESRFFKQNRHVQHEEAE